VGIAGHVSRAMLSRYSHVRMEAKRRALDEIAVQQNAADENRKTHAERLEQAAMLTQLIRIRNRSVIAGSRNRTSRPPQLMQIYGLRVICQVDVTRTSQD
jgi:hypothetical protein